MSCSAPPRYRILVALLAALTLVFSSCRSPAVGVPKNEDRHPVAKPWTKAAIESHEYLWLELSTGRGGYMTGPVLASDEKGEFLTTKTDATVHLALADVSVMDALDVEPPARAASTASVVASSFFALWFGVLLFLPAVAVYLLVT